MLALTFWWGIGASSHWHNWFECWVRWLHGRPLIFSRPVLSLVLAVCTPLLLLVGLCYLIIYFLSVNWLFFVYSVVLFYCLGRSNLSGEVHEYIAISQRGDNVAASRWVDLQREAVETNNVEADDWQKLHGQALDIISYRSFERLFAVLFWFFILGPIGALTYRLSVLYLDLAKDVHKNLAARWLWLLEWPGVRALGLSWALVGNFDSCIVLLKHDFLDFSKSSLALLSRSARGALGMTPATALADPLPKSPASEVHTSLLSAPIISGINTEPDSLGLVSSSLALIPRALLLWICVAALITLLI